MAVQPENIQVIIYDPVNGNRIIQGTPELVQPVVNAYLAAVPSAPAYEMQDTPLTNSATLVDPRTPSTPSGYAASYPGREYSNEA